jgi:transketolase
MGAAKYNAANLTAILDYNKFQQTGPSHQIMPSLAPVAEKWRAFGWHVQEIDGHDMAQILAAFDVAQGVTEQPQIIIAHTLKGRGLSPFEADKVSRKHGKTLDEAEKATAIAELAGDITVHGR